MDLGQKAKKTLQEYVPEIDKRLAKFFDAEIKKEFGFNRRQKEMVKMLLEHSKEHNLRPSKRLRGSLVHHGFLLSGKKINDKVWQAAVGIELIHTALLMHDDFMDKDEIRRGGPTTHKFLQSKCLGNEHFGNSMAISIGDAILCLGFELIMQFDTDNKAAKQLFRGIVNTGFGQAFDVALEADEKWTEDDCLTLHRAKTAIYTYHNPLVIGTILADITDSKILKIIYDYSMDAGVAFQLQDDILGVFGTPEKTGKSADSDLLQGKCTLLVLKVFQSGTAEQISSVKKVWGKLVASKNDLESAKQAIIKSGSYDYSKQKAKDLAKNAAITVSKLRKIKGLNNDSIDYLQGIAEYMVTREI